MENLLFLGVPKLKQNRVVPVGSASDSRARGPGLETQSNHILSFPFPLIQEGKLSITGERMCT